MGKLGWRDIVEGEYFGCFTFIGEDDSGQHVGRLRTFHIYFKGEQIIVLMDLHLNHLKCKQIEPVQLLQPAIADLIFELFLNLCEGVPLLSIPLRPQL